MRGLEYKVNQVTKRKLSRTSKSITIRFLFKKSSDVISLLEDCKMDVKSFVFIKSTSH